MYIEWKFLEDHKSIVEKLEGRGYRYIGGEREDLVFARKGALEARSDVNDLVVLLKTYHQ